MTVSFRQANEEDLDGIVRLEERCFPEEPWSRQMFTEELKNEMALFMVAEARDDEPAESESPETADAGSAAETKGELIGYFVAWAIPPLESQVGSIAVLPEYRRHGIGRRFMEILFDICREFGIPDIYLEVRVSNTPAIKLYESMGFKTDGLRKQYYQNGEDAYTMARHEDERR